ncbi:MAG TPA: 4Fe-4S dicluster domain-containing protein [Thermodesulfobacteriota bacterium]|nr:4Fe-4S dicluster domain-containing protein [Thermodesulfobacteriota bacterium]
MADTGFLPKENLSALLEALSKKFQVFAPVLEGDIVLFKRFASGVTLCLTRPANLPPKGIIFPQSEALFNFNFKKDPEDAKKVAIELKENLDFSPTIIFGSRPCDAQGFRIYDRVYLETDTADPYYKGRREKTTIITLACNAPSPGCFCTSVGRGPAETEGSDLMMTELENGYFFEPITEKGEEILKEAGLEDGSAYKEQSQKLHEKVSALVKKPFTTLEGIPEKLLSLFDNNQFWEEETAKCISCGACTYLCPTCYCFNITDEQVGNTGERIRSWDACMFFHFTLEASSHNPRPNKHQRLKNRVGHKFSYYPKKYNNVIACCGCGRCIRYCPMSVDISEIVAHAQGA